MSLFQMLFRCEGGDDLFEARIASQRVPPRQQLQFAIADAARKATGVEKLFAGEIVVTNPGGDSSQTHDYAHPVDRIFFHGKQLDRAPTFYIYGKRHDGSYELESLLAALERPPLS